MGKVGNGWSRTVSSQIRKQLDTVVSPKSRLTKTIKKPKKPSRNRKRRGSNRNSLRMLNTETSHRRAYYVPVRSKGFRGMINPDCPVCFGLGWVCENHPQRAWSEDVGCQCGAGMPCECYIEHALTFERLAAAEHNQELKAELAAQARAYRKLVAERAKQFGFPPPSKP
jgi:hypothetical protein